MITNLGKDLAVFSMQEEFLQLSLLLKYLVDELNLVRSIQEKHRHHILERSSLEFPENIFFWIHFPDFTRSICTRRSVQPGLGSYLDRILKKIIRIENIFSGGVPADYLDKNFSKLPDIQIH